MIAVKNASRQATAVDGCGVLAHGESGDAQDTPHTVALIDAGHLIEMPGTRKSPEKE